MSKYMGIYMAPLSELEKMGSNSTPEEKKAGMNAWMQWMKDNEDSIEEEGAPLGKAKTVSLDGVKDTKNSICGYTVVEAESHDAAAKLFEGHPHFGIPGGTIEVMECMEIPEME